MNPFARLAIALAMLGLLGGCAGGGPAAIEIPAGRYTEAFDAAREVLAGLRFELDRVDAAAGVLTTQPKATAGLATPWDEEQATLGQEVEDLANRQSRAVRITFEAGDAADVREATGPIAARVEVAVYRGRRSGWRLDTTSVRLSSFTEDPELRARGMWPRYSVAIAQDPLLAGRIARAMKERLARAGAG